jgi:hypothetical protein
MFEVGFEPMNPVFERAKTVHALDRAPTVIGSRSSALAKFRYTPQKIRLNRRRATENVNLLSWQECNPVL